MMTPGQFARLLAVLERLTEQKYTITGAADWPILVVIGGMLVAAIGLMWSDLKSIIKDQRTEWRSELKEVREENEKDRDIIWNVIRDCQKNCLPRIKTNDTEGKN